MDPALHSISSAPKKVMMSFRQVVETSSQWYPEVKSIFVSIMEWEDEKVLPLITTLNVVHFSKDQLAKLGNLGNLL